MTVYFVTKIIMFKIIFTLILNYCGTYSSAVFRSCWAPSAANCRCLRWLNVSWYFTF